MPASLVKDPFGLDTLILREPQGASAAVCLHGGQVISWKNSRGDELLFISSKATLSSSKTIRGGIPICFPQVSNLSSLEQYNLSRCGHWSLDPHPPPPPINGCQTFADLYLKLSDVKIKTQLHSGFELRLRVALGVASLTLTTRIKNIDSRPFSFTVGLHTYLSVSDISEVRVEGLETLDYLDNLRNKERFTEQGDAITFEGELDRVYLKTPTKIAVIDHEKKRTLVMKKEGLPDAVVWNPWDKKSKAISDLGNDDYKRMVCIEAAAVEKPIVLKPGQEWRGRQEITAVGSSYCSGLLEPLRL